MQWRPGHTLLRPVREAGAYIPTRVPAKKFNKRQMTYVAIKTIRAGAGNTDNLRIVIAPESNCVISVYGYIEYDLVTIGLTKGGSTLKEIRSIGDGMSISVCVNGEDVEAESVLLASSLQDAVTLVNKWTDQFREKRPLAPPSK